jgi:hypothetical protein
MRSIRVPLVAALTGPLFLSPAGLGAGPAFGVHAGVELVQATNGSDQFALPTDGRTLAPRLSAAYIPEHGRLGVQVELTFPHDMRKEIPGAIKSGPVTYVVTRRDAVASALLRGALWRRRALRLIVLGGASLVRNETKVRYSFQPPTPRSYDSHVGISGGLDLELGAGRVVVTLPLRVHYITGINHELTFGFAPGAILLGAGATIGWTSTR